MKATPMSRCRFRWRFIKGYVERSSEVVREGGQTSFGGSARSDGHRGRKPEQCHDEPRATVNESPAHALRLDSEVIVIVARPAEL